MDNWKKTISMSLIFVVAVALAFSLGLQKGKSSAESDNDDIIEWENEITVAHERNGEVINKFTFENTLTDQGKEFIRDKISALNASGHNVAGRPERNISFISLGNGSTVSAGDTQLDKEITVGGLSRSQGSTTAYGSRNFSVQNQFTATSDIGTVNTTALNWNSSGSSLVSGGAFGTEANILDGDQITVTHNVSLS
ncbi:MAG: hypothetical protein SVV03_00230 [Candidatus Nanohaloarchaea archaeon]|nr:hypothetical protein [Candidatus Nanohaloarchaea archaeon]